MEKNTTKKNKERINHERRTQTHKSKQHRMRKRMDEYGYYCAGKRGTAFLYECLKCRLVFMSFRDCLPGEYCCTACRRK